MTQQEKLALLEDTLEAGKGTLKPTTLLEDVEEYDSMTMLAIIVMMEDTFGVKVTGADMKSFVKVDDILARMEKKE